MRRVMLIFVLLVLGAPAASHQRSGYYYVTPEVLNERLGPGMSYAVINRIHSGKEVVVYAWQGVWARLTDLQAQARWVHGAYLSVDPLGPGSRGTAKVSEDSFAGRYVVVMRKDELSTEIGDCSTFGYEDKVIKSAEPVLREVW